MADERVAEARQLTHEYKLMGYHCSESIVRAVPQALGFEIGDDVIKAACGFFGGGGGTGGRCGVIESCIILMSVLYGRMDAEASDQHLRDMAAEFMKRFSEKFGSLSCCDIKPKEVEKYGEEFGCMRVYEEGAELVTRFLIDFGA